MARGRVGRRWTLTAAHHILLLRGHRLHQEFVRRAETEKEKEEKPCTESLECREEEKDLKDVHLGGYKQTQTQHLDKKGQQSKISIRLFHHDA